MFIIQIFTIQILQQDFHAFLLKHNFHPFNNNNLQDFILIKLLII